LTDRWYRDPVDCGRLQCETHYQTGSCPNAEKMSDTIINLPTHAKITVADAEKIIIVIKKYFESKK
jgi:dTDP-4-amino-4,6-dideoxygalactose transaminase